MSFRYRKLDVDGARYIWNIKDEEMYQLNPDTGDWVLRDFSIDLLAKWGYMKDVGGTNTFPGEKVVQVPQDDGTKKD